MPQLADRGTCTGCGACSAACPGGCIAMCPDEWGFLYPRIDRERCTSCGLCEKKCPIATAKAVHADTRAFGVRNHNNGIRLSSSSGGVFTILAEHVISSGGVVFGAAFDKNWDVVHICVETEAELGKLRGAKYVQSRIGNTYQQAKTFLQAERTVLFSGTPCQIGGLYAYLGKDYENLICQDVICHGVPAPGLWRRYVKEWEQRAGAPLQKMSFRSKLYGWQNYSVCMTFENGKRYAKSPMLDAYMRAFLNDLSLRPSCFRCQFKGISRQADITLADFWGIGGVLPEMDDDKGTSLVLPHTPKGMRLLDMLSKSAEVREVDVDLALRANPSSTSSAKKPEAYEAFLNETEHGRVTGAVDRYVKIPFLRRIRLEIYNKVSAARYFCRRRWRR